ncbi:hypothetical protein J2T60_001878 [Natronospira proteinivora]|uniref:Uncharacterized protein n=1 Tax=Natronospira proteinivora TaxID=1807133 RepID=A0ABT1GBX6_9GAMM|nr:hypothetical protein [Natronospira proteinivora]MCP1727878.1 hypothetical protein [Natronospira proteinivora]
MTMTISAWIAGLVLLFLLLNTGLLAWILRRQRRANHALRELTQHLGKRMDSLYRSTAEDAHEQLGRHEALTTELSEIHGFIHYLEGVLRETHPDGLPGTHAGPPRPGSNGHDRQNND